jgi:hypothetical protein
VFRGHNTEPSDIHLPESKAIPPSPARLAMKSSDSSGTFAIKQDASIDFDAHPVKAIRSPV